MPQNEELVIGLVSISDRASTGIYEDKGIPALQEWLASALTTPWRAETRLIADDRAVIENALIELVDHSRCHLVLTTGGTGPAPRDVTPEATLAVGDKEMPGFGEEMRRISLNFVPTAILSRQVAVIRKQALIINLPGQPKSIKETLEGVRATDGKVTHVGIFAAVPFIVIGGEWLGLFGTLNALIPLPIGAVIVLIAGFPVFRNVVRATLNRQIISHTLMTLGVIAALAVGEWATAAVVVFFMRVGDYAERFTAERARRAVLRITGYEDLLGDQPVVRDRVAQRNPCSDVLSLLQLELLRRYRAAAGEEEAKA